MIARADAIRRGSGATVLLVHHSRKDGDQERGSVALRGAVDTLFRTMDEDGQKRLVCEKQKDAAPWEPLAVELHPVNLTSPGGSGQPLPAATSCVFTSASPTPSRPDVPTPQMRAALLTLADSFLEHGATASEWLRAGTIPERSFYRVVTNLVRAGLVTDPGRKRGAPHQLTRTGRHRVEQMQAGASLSAQSGRPLDADEREGRRYA